MFCQTIQSFFELHSLNSLFFHFFDHMTALCVRADDLIALFHHETSAFLAVDPCRFLPGHKFTFRIVFTTVIFSAFFRLFDHYFFSTERTGNSCFFQIRLRVTAIRESRAGKEFSVRAVFYYHISSTLFTDHIRNLILNLHFF